MMVGKEVRASLRALIAKPHQWMEYQTHDLIGLCQAAEIPRRNLG